jgi:hypothetical protein
MKKRNKKKDFFMHVFFLYFLIATAPIFCNPKNEGRKRKEMKKNKFFSFFYVHARLLFYVVALFFFLCILLKEFFVFLFLVVENIYR